MSHIYTLSHTLLSDPELVIFSLNYGSMHMYSSITFKILNSELCGMRKSAELFSFPRAHAQLRLFSDSAHVQMSTFVWQEGQVCTRT